MNRAVLESPRPLSRPSGVGFFSPWAHRLLLFALFFAAVAPTATWMDFSGGMENFNVATATESARHDRWLVPTLHNQPRFQKPPFTHWTTEAGVKSSASLRWGARWPSIVMGAMLVVAVYELGRAIEGEPLGLLSALAFGTTLIFLKFAWQASYDLQLTLWTTVTNVFLARAAFRGQRTLGCAGAGVALGLAVMTKGPIAILQTVVPLLALFAVARWTGRASLDGSDNASVSRPARGARPGDVETEETIERRDPLATPSRGERTLTRPASGAAKRDAERPNAATDIEALPAIPETSVAPSLPRWRYPLFLGVALFLLVALPWPIYFLRATGLSWRDWYEQMTLRTEAGYERRTRWHTYLAIFVPMMLPWAIWFFVGLVHVWRERPRELRLLILPCWVFVPIAVMNFAPELRDRYVLPMYPAVAVIAGYGLRKDLRPWADADPAGRALILGHAAIVLAIAIGLPLAGRLAAIAPRAAERLHLTTVDGQPWYSLGLTLGAIGLALAVAGVSAVLYRRRPAALVGGTVVLMLGAQALFLWGYKDSDSGRSDGRAFAGAILSRYPNAVVYNARPDRRDLPLEALIYLGRDVTNLPNPIELPPGQAPQILVYPPAAQPAGEDVPPPGFAPLDVPTINDKAWRTYVRARR